MIVTYFSWFWIEHISFIIWRVPGVLIFLGDLFPYAAWAAWVALEDIDLLAWRTRRTWCGCLTWQTVSSRLLVNGSTYPLSLVLMAQPPSHI